MTKESCVFILHLLHASVWPKALDEEQEIGDGESGEATARKTSLLLATNNKTNNAASVHHDHRSGGGGRSVAEAEKALVAYCHAKLPFYRYSLVAHKVNRAINFVLQCLQLPERNKLFVYQVINVIARDVKEKVMVGVGREGAGNC